MEDVCNPSSPPSFGNKIKESLCFSCCFRRRDGGHFSAHHSPPSPSDDNAAVAWIKSKGPHNHSLLEIKDKCCTMLGFSGAKHRRHSSVEFRYDPLSYAMNFEDGFEYNDDAPLRNFAARLPPSPPLPSAKWRKNESKDKEVDPSSSLEESYGGKLVSNPVGGPDTRQIKKKLHPSGAPTDFFVDKVVAENIKKKLSRIRTEISATDSDARLTDDEIEAISTKLPVDKEDLNKLFPRSWCDQYSDVVLDVVRKEFKEHMREMGNHKDGERHNKFEINDENSHPNIASINSSSSIDKGFKYNPFFDL